MLREGKFKSLHRKVRKHLLIIVYCPRDTRVLNKTKHINTAGIQYILTVDA